MREGHPRFAVAKIGLDRGLAGPLIGPSAYFMKSPPVQFHDDEAYRMVEDFARSAEVPEPGRPARSAD